MADLGESPTPRHRTRYSRRRFLVMSGAFAAGLAAVVAFFKEVGGGGGSGGSGSGIFRHWPLNNVESIPHVAPQQWTIDVDGMVETPLHLDWTDWQKLKRENETVNFHCVEGWTVDDVTWGGVQPWALIEMAKPLAGAAFVNFHARSGEYFDNLTIDEVKNAQTLLADTLDGAPLPDDHGGPLRLVVPAQMGYKSVKWVTRIELVDKLAPGYWEQRGYPVEAPISG
jgi:sulfoxide reductase catalytic subunit YedY